MAALALPPDKVGVSGSGVKLSTTTRCISMKIGKDQRLNCEEHVRATFDLQHHGSDSKRRTKQSYIILFGHITSAGCTWFGFGRTKDDQYEQTMQMSVFILQLLRQN